MVVHLQRHFGVSYATIRVRLLQERLSDKATFDRLAQVSPSRLARALGYPVHPADMGTWIEHLAQAVGGSLAIAHGVIGIDTDEPSELRRIRDALEREINTSPHGSGRYSKGSGGGARARHPAAPGATHDHAPAPRL
jgi:low affinity Fe/Cu permease